MPWRSLLLSLAVLLAGLQQASALDCTPVEGRLARPLSGEIAGAHRFETQVGPGWRFVLEPARFGWDLRVLNDEDHDLSAATPPLHGANARDLYGWHFRDAGNTGPNDGSVNAPQELRLFQFDPGGGAPPDSGRGWLAIEDFGLADLKPGEKARLVYLRFHGCLIWPGETPPTPPPMTVSPETEEIFRACGLPPGYAIATRLNRVSLGGDFDGDGSLDEAVLARRKGDGQHGLAVCRAGTWLDLVGFDRAIGELVPAYFDRIDWWALTQAGPVGLGAGGSPPPVLRGDGITIGKEDSSSVLVYWTPRGYRSYWQGD